MRTARIHKPNVFISYSHANNAEVQPIYESLRRMRDFRVWMAPRLEPGQQFKYKIQSEIERCSVFLLMVSPASVTAAWVAAEFFFADELGKEIVPMLLQTTDVPGEISGKYHIEEIDKLDLQHKIEAIKVAVKNGHTRAVRRNSNVATVSPTPLQLGRVFILPPVRIGSNPLDAEALKIDLLYQAGANAYEEGNFEHALEQWRPVLHEQPTYLDGEVMKQAHEVESTLLARWVDDIRLEEGQAKTLEKWEQVVAHAREYLEDWEDWKQLAAHSRERQETKTDREKREELATVLYPRALCQCMLHAAMIGNWDKALDNLRDYQRAHGLTRQQRQKAGRQHDALEQNQRADPDYEEARRYAQAQQDEEVEAALKRTYNGAPAYSDRYGLIAQLARKRVAKQEARRAQYDKEEAKTNREHRRLGPLLNWWRRRRQEPPVVQSQDAIEREMKERLKPPPKPQLNPSVIREVLVPSSTSALLGICRVILRAPFLRSASDMFVDIGLGWHILAAIVYYGALAYVVWLCFTYHNLALGFGISLALIFLFVLIAKFRQIAQSKDVHLLKKVWPDDFDTLFSC